MKNIDFLPASYRQQHAKRHVHFWRIVVVAAFVFLVFGASLVQYFRLCHARGYEKDLAAQYATAEAQNRQWSRIQAQREAAVGDAELFTYLRHPWPRTRILAAMLAPLPDSITLSQLEIKAGVSAGVVRGQRRLPGRPTPTEEVESPKLPSQRDLAMLREQFDSKAVTAVLSGRTTDPAALHRYLGELHRCSLFPKVELDKLESVAPGENIPEGTMAFTTIVEVRAGYGQAGGPTGSDVAGSVGAVKDDAADREDVSKAMGQHSRGAFVSGGNRGGDSP
ncbi:MAG TPA: hypothetical protein DD670_07165 [Planctomycetaceae bacterium]|nr:hypothetical protein [Planctomycetaceae bacterium]